MQVSHKVTSVQFLDAEGSQARYLMTVRTTDNGQVFTNTYTINASVCGLYDAKPYLMVDSVTIDLENTNEHTLIEESVKDLFEEHIDGVRV